LKPQLKKWGSYLVVLAELRKSCHRLTNDCECYFGSFGADLDALDCGSRGRQARSHPPGDEKADTKTHQERKNGSKWSQADTTRPKAASCHLRLARGSLSGDSISVLLEESV
jgi:hypothetical protein